MDYDRRNTEICYRLRKEISEKINRMPMKYFESRTYGEVLSRITNDVDTLGQGLNQSVTQVITSTATLIGVVVMMLTISPLMTLIAFIILPFLSHLSPHYFFDEETLPPPSYYRYGLWLGLFSFCTRHCGSFAGYAYLVRVVLSGFKCLPFVADSSIDFWYLHLPVSGLPTAWRHLGAKTLRAWWSMKWSVCGLLCLQRLPDMYGMHWEHLSCSVCLIYSSPWAFAVWKVCRVESG